MRGQFARFLKDSSGATAIEYGLIAGFIALAIVAVVGQMGQTLTTFFQGTADKM
jgi:pilus assembly protein Flp/PilA